MQGEFRREKEAVDQQTAQLARRLRNVKVGNFRGRTGSS